MLEHTLDTENGILHLHPKSALQESDFAELASVVDPYLEGHGELKGVIVEAPDGFPGWSSFAAMTAHLRFVRDHHRRIRKIGIVTDTHLADVAEKLGSHFISATIKHFPSGHAAEAERWILGVKPLAFTWPYAVPFWAIYVWAFWPEFAIVRRAGKEKTATDAKSLQVILLGMWFAYLLAFPIALLRALQFPSHPTFWFWLGLAVLAGGSALRRHCFRLLGSSFTGDVRARADQVVITRGAYAFVRHPAYTGGILMNTGIGIALGSWGAALLLAVVSIAVYTYRMNIEERALLATIGEPYREFMRTRRRIIPFVY